MRRINLGLEQKYVFRYRASLLSVLPHALLFVIACHAVPLVSHLVCASPVQANSNHPKNFLTEADNLRSQWNAASWREALRKYQAVLPKLRRSGLPREEARVLRSLGLVYLALGNTSVALDKLTASLALLEQLKLLDVEMVNTLNDVTNAHLLIGNNSQARTHCKRALDLSRQLRYAKGEGLSLELMGQAEYLSGNLTQSLDLYAAAFSILRKENDNLALAQTLLDFGYSYSDLSETEKATQSFEQALVLWRDVKNPRGEALTLTALGHLHSKLGNKQRAFNLYYQSIQLLQPLEDRIAMAYNFDGLAYIHYGLGEKSTALQEYTKKLELFREAGYRYGEIGALWQIGEIHIANENYQEALKYLNKSLTLGISMGDPRLQSTPAALIGQVHELQNKPAQALQAYKHALTLIRAGKDPRQEAYTLNSIGRVQEMLTFREEALANYTQALTLNRSTGDRFGESGTLYNIAKIQQAMGRLKEAKQHSQQSIALVESLRAGLASHDLRSSYVATVHQQYELYIDILMSLHAEEPSAGFDRAAVEASEAGRSRTLLETLAETKAQIRQGVDPKLLERERALQLQLESLATRQVKSLNTSDDQVLEAEIERVTAQHREIQGQIRAHSPNYAALVQPVPLKVEQIQQLLEPGTLLLEYSLGEKRSFVWALTHESITSYELPSRANIEKIAHRLYSAITRPDGVARLTTYGDDSRNLSSTLLGPITNHTETKRLVIVADGILQYLPFGALVEPRALPKDKPETNSQASHLVSHYEIVRIPSASVLAVQRTQLAGRVPAPKSVAVLADPVFDKWDGRVTNQTPRVSNGSRLRTANPNSINASPRISRSLSEAGISVNGRIQRLVFSLTEAEAVYAVSPQADSLKAIGFKASRATATGPELSQYKIIHVATHGVLNSKHPELSGILLSMVDENGDPVNGFLQLHEIYNLKLPAELVVLSACETGIGKQIRGEGLIALTRGFMYAGAARVVATLWKVDDSATAALMTQFYKEIFLKGKPPAAALRAAQIYISEQKRWREPYYWAGFVLQGEWR